MDNAYIVQKSVDELLVPRHGLWIVLSSNRDAANAILPKLRKRAATARPACRVRSIKDFGNNLHHRRIDELVDLYQNRSPKRIFVVTTMNPEVIDNIGFETAEQVKAAFVFVRKTKGSVALIQLGDGAAYSFMRSYEVGIQQVSDILRANGHW